MTRKEARSNQRHRLLGAMAHLVGTDGYANTSIAQVIAHAGVSRKAFYEYFTDKEDCFLAAYEELSDRLVNALVDAGSHTKRGRTQAQLKLYLEALSRDLPMARAFVIEVLAAGPRGLAVREQVNGRFAKLVFGHTSRDALVRKAIIGGVNDVVAGALMAGKKDLTRLLPHLVAFAEFQSTKRQARRTRAPRNS